MKGPDPPRQLRLTTGGRAYQGPRQVGAPQESLRQHAEEACDTLQLVVALDRLLAHAPLELLGFELHGGDQQIFLAAKASVERAERHARVGRHVSQTHRLETACLSELNRALDDATRSVLRLDGHRRIETRSSR
jgi:hypothetical protein